MLRFVWCIEGNDLLCLMLWLLCDSPILYIIEVEGKEELSLTPTFAKP